MLGFFINNNRLGYLVVLALMAMGIFSVFSIQQESSPEVEIPIALITTVLPGAPAADIETLVTNEIESAASNVENIDTLTSVSSEGVSTVTVEFLESADIDDAISDLKDAIDRVKGDLPDDANDPIVTQIDFVNKPIITAAIGSNDNIASFSALATQLEDELESVAGVSDVSIGGVADREITVLVNNTDLVRYDISINQIVQALQQANVAFPVGQIENNGTSYNIAIEGKLSDTESIKNVGITTRGGQPVLVRDVATVIDGLAPLSTLSRISINGDPSVQSMSVNIFKQSGGDVTVIAAAAREKLEDLQEPGGLLENAEVQIMLDNGELITKDLVNLSSSGLQTILLVVIVLIIAIGWREGLLAGTAIPLSFLIGFIGLYYSGNTINFLSLFSLILGIGILVDSAIVMVEGVNTKMKADLTIDKKEAALSTVREFAAPITSGTLTTIAMFSGLLVVSGITGQFIESIPYTLIFLLVASLFVALGIIPLFASTVLKRQSATTFEQKQVEYAHQAEAWYRKKLEKFFDNQNLQHQFLAGINAAFWCSILIVFNLIAALIATPLIYITGKKLFDRQTERNWSNLLRIPLFFITVAIIIGGSMFLTRPLPQIGLVEVIFFPSEDADYVFVEIETKTGTTKEVTDMTVRQIEDILYSKPDIESFQTTVGSGNAYTSGGSGEQLANIFVLMKEERSLTSGELTKELEAEFVSLNETADISIAQLASGPPTGAPILVKFLGDDIDELTTLTNQAAELLRSIPDTKDVKTSANGNSTEYVLDIDTLKASSLGLTLPTISQAARSAVYGADATSITSLTDDTNVVVKLNTSGNPALDPAESNVTTIDNITRTELLTANGTTVPISTVATVRVRKSASSISHENQKRVMQLEGNVTGDGNSLTISTELLARIQTELDVPDGVEISTGGGEAEETNQAFAEMGFALIVGITLMVGVLVLQFNSYLHTTYVLSILPYSLIGIFTGLAITQNALSFPSMMGFIALSGIVVNNSILLIDMINLGRKKNPEKDIRTVILDASSSRLRPILLTTTTTVVGMIPLTYADEIWAPLAYAVMFGLIFSVIITLVLVPVMYLRKPGIIGR